LFPHLDTNGFEQHGDGFSLHYPGDTADLVSMVHSLRVHAFKMSGQNPPPPSLIPPAPLITSLSRGKIAWRGSAGAGVYSIQRGTTAGGPFSTLCDKCVTDNPGFWESSAIVSGWYRVQPWNLDGRPGPYSPTKML